MGAHQGPSCAAHAQPLRTSYRRLALGQGLSGAILKTGFEKVPGWESLYVHRERGIFLGVYVDDFHMAGKAEFMQQTWADLRDKEKGNLSIGPEIPFDHNTYLGCSQVDVEPDMEAVNEKCKLYQFIHSCLPNKLKMRCKGNYRILLRKLSRGNPVALCLQKSQKEEKH